MAAWKRRSTKQSAEPLSVTSALTTLGLSSSCTVAEISDARRRLAKTAHPDVGGTAGEMRLINAAAELLIDHRSQPSGQVGAPDIVPSRPSTKAEAPVGGRTRVDHPSFVVEALPVEAFEALLVVAAWLGEIIDDEPPYRLDVALTEPPNGWCQLTLVPDAGASTVSIAVGGAPGWPLPDLDSVRDQWVSGLNQLDWDDLTPPC